MFWNHLEMYLSLGKGPDHNHPGACLRLQRQNFKSQIGSELFLKKQPHEHNCKPSRRLLGKPIKMNADHLNRKAGEGSPRRQNSHLLNCTLTLGLLWSRKRQLLSEHRALSRRNRRRCIFWTLFASLLKPSLWICSCKGYDLVCCKHIFSCSQILFFPIFSSKSLRTWVLHRLVSDPSQSKGLYVL